MQPMKYRTHMEKDMTDLNHVSKPVDILIKDTITEISRLLASSEVLRRCSLSEASSELITHVTPSNQSELSKPVLFPCVEQRQSLHACMVGSLSQSSPSEARLSENLG